jgi:hypothetical protein
MTNTAPQVHFMPSSAAVVTSFDTLIRALELLDQYSLAQLPVVGRKGELIAVLTRSQVESALDRSPFAYVAEALEDLQQQN